MPTAPTSLAPQAPGPTPNPKAGACALADAPPALSFEEALKSLESVVDTLERGDSPLEEALSAYERGVTLLKQCQSFLSTAEQRVRIWDAGTDTLQDFADTPNKGDRLA
jgi:exodeoxyribonuclease VII small subunit